MKHYHQLLPTIVEAMPELFDTHDAEKWYSENYPTEFAADLAACGGNEHSLSKGFGLKLLYSSPVRKTGRNCS